MNLLKQLQRDYQEIKFIKGKTNVWSPKTKEIYYSAPISKYSLLHELGHALQKHTTYKLDIQLIKLEADAWQEAQKIAQNYNLKISQSYINNCMNTYKDWLLARSKCPACDLVGLQSIKTLHYNCCNCFLTWSVPFEPKCLVKRIVDKSKVSKI